MASLASLVVKMLKLKYHCNSVNLKHTYINTYLYVYTNGLKNAFKKTEEGQLMEPCAAGFLHRVKQVYFHCFSGFDSEKEMIKRFLQKAVVLV